MLAALLRGLGVTTGVSGIQERVGPQGQGALSSFLQLQFDDILWKFLQKLPLLPETFDSAHSCCPIPRSRTNTTFSLARA